MQTLRQFLLFLRAYAVSRILAMGRSFEAFKDIIVAFLIVKRGK